MLVIEHPEDQSLIILDINSIPEPEIFFLSTEFPGPGTGRWTHFLLPQWEGATTDLQRKGNS